MKTLFFIMALTPLTLYNSESNYHFLPRPHYTKAEIYAKEVKCMAVTIYSEARGESFLGLVAVAYTLVNRAVNSTVCAVALAPKQYSAYNDNPKLQAVALNLNINLSLENKIDRNSWEQALQVSHAVLKRRLPDPTHGATHYLNPDKLTEMPKWANEFELVAVIDNHQFYRQ